MQQPTQNKNCNFEQQSAKNPTSNRLQNTVYLDVTDEALLGQKIEP